MIIEGRLSSLFNQDELNVLNMDSIIHCPILIDGKIIGAVTNYSIGNDTFKGVIFDKCISSQISASNYKDIFCLEIQNNTDDTDRFLQKIMRGEDTDSSDIKGV